MRVGEGLIAVGWTESIGNRSKRTASALLAGDEVVASARAVWGRGEVGRARALTRSGESTCGKPALPDEVAQVCRKWIGAALGDRTDGRQQRQRLRAGPSLELRGEPADQRLLKSFTGTCDD